MSTAPTTAPAIGSGIEGLRATERGTILDPSGTVTAHGDASRGAFTVTFSDGETSTYSLSTFGEYWARGDRLSVRAGRDWYAAGVEARPSRFANDGRDYSAWAARADAWTAKQPDAEAAR